MRIRVVGSVFAVLLSAGALASLGVSALEPVVLIPIDGEGSKYWSRWRGPSGQGAVTGTNYVDAWSDTTNVKWKVPVAGRGHSSPIVWKDHIFITTATEGGAKVSMVAYRTTDGTLLWNTTVPSTGVEHTYHKNSHASATPVTDGQRIYASFGTHGLAAFDFSGKLVWHQKLGDLNNYHGSAGSPVLYQDRLFIFQDHGGPIGSFVAAFSATTGEVIWKKERSAGVGWGTPIVIDAGDHDELVVSSQQRVFAYDPDTGTELWTVRGNTREVIPTPVVGRGLVFCSSGGARTRNCSPSAGSRGSLLHALCHQLFGGEVCDVARERDLVGRDDRAGVGDLDLHPLELQGLAEGHLVAVHLAVENVRLAEVRLHLAGERRVLHHEVVGVFLFADLRVERRGPLAGDVRGANGHQRNETSSAVMSDARRIIIA